MLRLAFDFIITWRETRTRPNAYQYFDLPCKFSDIIWKCGIEFQKSSINVHKTKYIEYIYIQREEKQANEQRKPNNTLSGQ